MTDKTKMNLWLAVAFVAMVAFFLDYDLYGMRFRTGLGIPGALWLAFLFIASPFMGPRHRR
jgi:hypothetical protein